MEEKFAAGGGSVRRKVGTPEEAEGWRREEVLYRELFIRCKVGYMLYSTGYINLEKSIYDIVNLQFASFQDFALASNRQLPQWCWHSESSSASLCSSVASQGASVCFTPHLLK